MKETGIIYSQDMVKAKLAGRKTQTRRLTGLDPVNEDPENWIFKHMCDFGEKGWFAEFHKNITFIDLSHPGHVRWIRSPYGGPGDWLWTRETWCNYAMAGQDGATGIIFRADDYSGKITWKPGIHLRKADARLWDEILEIYPERLKKISKEDAIAEGIASYQDRYYKIYGVKGDSIYTSSSVESFKSLICSIHGPDIWDKNPWVWRIRFKELSRTVRPTSPEGATYTNTGCKPCASTSKYETP